MELAAQTNPVKFLILDRDTKFTAYFDGVITADGTTVIETPVRAPRTNAICEHVIDTIRGECLDRMLVLGDRSSGWTHPRVPHGCLSWVECVLGTHTPGGRTRVS